MEFLDSGSSGPTRSDSRKQIDREVQQWLAIFEKPELRDCPTDLLHFDGPVQRSGRRGAARPVLPSEGELRPTHVVVVVGKIVYVRPLHGAAVDDTRV
jgi:hypothetical protein